MSQESPGRLYVNGVFNFSVKKMFDLLFTNSDFSQRFMDARKTTGKYYLLYSYVYMSYSIPFHIFRKRICIHIYYTHTHTVHWIEHRIPPLFFFN